MSWEELCRVTARPTVRRRVRYARLPAPCFVTDLSPMTCIAGRGAIGRVYFTRAGFEAMPSRLSRRDWGSSMNLAVFEGHPPASPRTGGGEAYGTA
jgi:hypothetical protein